MTVLLVAVGAALGAPLRWWVDRALRARFGAAFPWGTLAVNVAGSFLLGVVVSADGLDPAAVAGLGAGFCGALTTYSTVGLDTVRLVERRARRAAVAYALVSVLGGVLAAAMGLVVGAAAA